MIEIRPVRPDEFAEAGRITASAWQPAGDADERWLRFSARIADVAGRADITSVFVAVEGGRILASVTLELDGRMPDDVNPAPLRPGEAHIRLLGVAPEARRRGIARMLMEHCMRVAREHGKERLTLNTWSRNFGAQALYESMGFSRGEDIVAPTGFRAFTYEYALSDEADSRMAAAG